MTRKILFLVDHKHRDLPSLTLIGCHLQQLGLETHFIGLGNEVDVIDRLDPEFLVLPKPIYDFTRLLQWRKEGRRLIVIETEGNPQDLEFELRIRVPPDLYLFWNETIAQRYRERLQRAGTAVRVVGFPRSDFLHPRLDALFPSREELLLQSGLNPARFTVTIATSGQDSHFSEKRVADKRRRRSRSFARTADYLEIVRNMRELRDKTTEFVETLLTRFPQLNIAIKPHPHENAVFWSDFVQSLQNPNVVLVVGEPINHLLRVSDLHVSYNVCTTTVEGLLLGLPVAEIQTKRSSALYGKRHLSLPTYKLMEFSDLENAIVAELSKSAIARDKQRDAKSRLDAYISDFLYAFDGRRCETYARTIAEWSDSSRRIKPGWRYLAAHPKQTALYLSLYARRVISLDAWMARRVAAEGLVARVNAPRRGNGRALREIKGKLVDEEFGLYDNRMKQGDERIWVDRFRKAGVV